MLKLLAQRGESNSTRGRLALSLLIAQDLAVVTMVLVVPQLGATDKSPAGGALELAKAVGIAVVVVVLVIVVARRAMPPLQVLFSAAFFVSVGMLLDLGYLVTNLPLVLAGVAAVLVLKVLTTSLALVPLRVVWRAALATALLLA